MKVIFVLAADVLREASRRRWVLVLGLVISLLLLLLFGVSRLEIVNNTLSFSTGGSGYPPPQDAAIAARPIFKLCAYFIYYGGLLFGTLACADFAPTLMSPGRIEHLLSLPVKRRHVIFGMFLGIGSLAAAATLYAAGGLTLILGIKTGVWSFGPLFAGLLACVAWGSIYSIMLVAATLARSAALSAALGLLVFWGGIIASHRAGLLQLFAPGPTRSVFAWVSALFPRIASLGQYCAKVAASEPIQAATLGAVVAGFLAFAAVGLGLASWSLERRDF